MKLRKIKVKFASNSNSNLTEENIKVILRIKPNKDKDKLFLTHNSNTNYITIPGKDNYVFDKVADSNISQEDIFENCKGLFQSFLDGYNATIFTYGQTGSGKTFTMTGDIDNVGNTRNPGIIPRGLMYIFDKVNERALTSGVEYLIKCSFVEIYNEQIYDLLDPQQQRLNLRLNITQEMYLEQCTEVIMDSPEDAFKILQQGLVNRHIASTEMNRESSRSHAVFQIILESRESQGEIDNIKKSCLYLVDLAGSERQRHSKAESIRLREACIINKSLLSLTLVIQKLEEAAKSTKTIFIPYRDSKLTLLLKDALGGNSKTALIACIHNDTRFMSDTCSTLHFARSVKKIRNKAKINVNIHGDNKALRKEIILLQEQLLKYKTPQLIQCHEFDYDLVWKKRFITAMALRSCLSLDVSNLNNQIAHTNNMSLKLEKTIDNLKLERELNKMKMKRLEETSENIVDDDFRLLLNNTLKTLNENTVELTEQIKSNEIQIKVDYLQSELAKSKTLNMLATSDKTLFHSLLNDYNNIIDSGCMDEMFSKIGSQDIEIINLKEELSQSQNDISDLKKKIYNGDLDRRDERRRLEAEIASMKFNLKIVDEQRKTAVVERRRTLLSINDLHNKTISPMKALNSRRQSEQPKLVTTEGDEENIQPLDELLKKNNQDNLDKIDKLEASLRIKQTELGNMSYKISDYKTEIEELKSIIFSKELIEQNLKDMEEKYTSANMALEESYETIKRLRETVSLEESKDMIIKKLTEQKYNLNEQLRYFKLEIEISMNDLEEKNLSMLCLNKEYTKIKTLLFLFQNECCEKEEKNNDLLLKLVEKNEELDIVKLELSTCERKYKILKSSFNDLIKSSAELDAELRSEKKRNEYLAIFLEGLIKQLNLTSRNSLIENMTIISNKLISYKHDLDEFDKMSLRQRLVLEDYCKQISSYFELLKELQNNIKKEFDEIINLLPRGQKINFFTKYKERNAKLKQENLKLWDENTAMNLWLTHNNHVELFETFYSAYKKKL